MNPMRAIRLLFLLMVCASQAKAQNPAQLQLAGDLTEDQATTILQAAQQLAQAQEILVNIAVVDAGANLKAFLRMDGSYLGSIDVAIKKAKTARLFNGPTGEIGKITQPGGDIYQIEVSNGGLITFPGGVPIRDKQGVIIGAIGISGGSIAQDHEIASKAAKSILVMRKK